MQNKKILVVEDEVIIAMALEDGLIAAGADPVSASTIDGPTARRSSNNPQDKAPSRRRMRCMPWAAATNASASSDAIRYST